MSDARRLDRLLMVAPYAALAGATALVLASGDSRVPVPVMLAVVAATAGWMLWCVTLHPGWVGHPPRMAGFFVGLVLLAGVLVWCSPLFGFFAWTGYLFIVYALPGRWRIAGAAAVAVLTAAAQAGGFIDVDGAGFAILLAFNVVVAVALTMLATQHREQQATVARANRQLADALAENAALQTRLLSQARAAGVLDERQRLAGEIHDVLAQGLTGIVTQLEAAEATVGRPAEWRRHVDAAKRLARDSLAEARRSVRALRPGSLDGAALPEALGDLVDGWSRLTGVPASLIVTGAADRLHPDADTTLLRAAQEALTNVGRHARANRVALTLSYLEDLVTLDIRDDGAGFDPAAVDAGRYGLAAMRDRVARVGGTIEVESAPGEGTAIAVCLPVLVAA
ncbi:signal transduction histidine kinase [Asanoa ferruginea]|uniref:Oxygen sensor histidine kinase NreB n=1 Tax=Asanoa ferruginea TaxID=53367 RepID=A0A3D9ZVH8_9ACTN|nr:sensor histidine kinase [Asanoa ferruginea]REG01319.1 signal transduction histidine kinase [Asanoa ferruginea]GIF52191.1 histidine kinase [Asanoa ferruginea]